MSSLTVASCPSTALWQDPAQEWKLTNNLAMHLSLRAPDQETRAFILLHRLLLYARCSRNRQSRGTRAQSSFQRRGKQLDRLSLSSLNVNSSVPRLVMSQRRVFVVLEQVEDEESSGFVLWGERSRVVVDF